MINFYFHVNGKVEAFERGLIFQELRFSHGGDGLIGRVTSKELKIFPMELGFFEKLRIFKWGI